MTHRPIAVILLNSNMFRNKSLVNELKIPSPSGAVVLYRAQEALDLRPQIAAGLLVAFTLFTSGQVGYVYSQSTEENLVSGPITSVENPITSAETTPPTNTGGGNNGNSNGSGSGGSAGAPSCNDVRPSKAPIITSAIVTAPNEVNIDWTKAGDPVTNYVISYGLKPNTPLYGNPNVGGKDTTSYTVKGLSSGVTYYFKVRAGNNCMPGEYSNEVSVKVVNGAQFNTPAVGFKQGVLGTKSAQVLPSQKPAASPEVSNKPQVQDEPNILEQIVDFFNKLFN